MKLPESSRSSHDDRRQAERHSSDQDATCHPASRSDITIVKIKDVSRRGVGLVSPRRFEATTLLVLELDETASSPVHVIARVVRIVSRPGGDWLVGCAFLSELSEEEFTAFRSSRVVQANENRRADHRQKVRRMAVCRPMAIGTLGSLTAEVCDMSAQGIGLLVTTPVEVGVRLKVEIAARETEKAQTQLVSVVRSEPQPDGRWRLGCEVLPSPQAAQSRAIPANAK
jgi:hypothetical protein